MSQWASSLSSTLPWRHLATSTSVTTSKEASLSTCHMTPGNHSYNTTSKRRGQARRQHFYRVINIQMNIKMCLNMLIYCMHALLQNRPVCVCMFILSLNILCCRSNLLVKVLYSFGVFVTFAVQFFVAAEVVVPAVCERVSERWRQHTDRCTRALLTCITCECSACTHTHTFRSHYTCKDQMFLVVWKISLNRAQPWCYVIMWWYIIQNEAYDRAPPWGQLQNSTMKLIIESRILMQSSTMRHIIS